MNPVQIIATGLGGISTTPVNKANRKNINSCGRCGLGISTPRRDKPAFCRDCWWTDPEFCRDT